MLFCGTISMQPDTKVLTQRKKPTKVFAKLFHALALGKLSPKEKHQTFCAVSILQELNIALRKVGVDNIVRLAKDGNDFYYDDQRKENDLTEAMREFDVNNEQLASGLFEDICLVLEHQDEKLRYLIEIDIKRVHSKHEMPIQVTIYGVMNEFERQSDETVEQLQARLQRVLKAQTSKRVKEQKTYNSYIGLYQNRFDNFVQQVRTKLADAIECIEVNKRVKKQILRPEKHGATEVKDPGNALLIHRGYPGWQEAALYTFLWFPVMLTLGKAIEKVQVVRDDGELLLDLQLELFEDSIEHLLDLHALASELPSAKDEDLCGYSSGGSDSSSWLDFGSSDSSSSSSCGSSCGSGCGGGCGS